MKGQSNEQYAGGATDTPEASNADAGASLRQAWNRTPGCLDTGGNAAVDSIKARTKVASDAADRGPGLNKVGIES